ncbi:hypothetical protein B0I35DRAFT_463212 [Stachybotrys elegans]|uniref:RRM domain-containing protein n=1 Tax=Stachybotrys elegans TaxID=80388 RepID=A0A8K0SHV8_9HYPO|nr:hypothetical protein B0I35DRAFT_463212 [Stachybotrys elegans]
MVNRQQLQEQTRRYRALNQLGIAASIHFRTSRAEFEDACRARLTNPERVRFIWEDSPDHWRDHVGQAFIAFERRDHLDPAITEMSGLVLHGRGVLFRRARGHDMQQRRGRAAPPALPAVNPAPPARAAGTAVVSTVIAALPRADFAAALAEFPMAELIPILPWAVMTSTVNNTDPDDLLPDMIRHARSVMERVNAAPAAQAAAEPAPAVAVEPVAAAQEAEPPAVDIADAQEPEPAAIPAWW